MDITCDSCQSKFKIADEKIPEGKTVSLSCPKCKSKISVKQEEKEDVEGFETENSDNLSYDFDEDFGEDYDSSDKTFEFIEDEGKTAMICESDSEIKKQIKPVLDFMEYHIIDVGSARDAIKKLRYNKYDLIIINESFDAQDPDTNGVLIYLSRLPMIDRRNIFVTMLSNRFRTLDLMTSLGKSVNMIVNLKNLNEFENILKHGVSDSDMFYRIYQETLKNTGKI